MSKYEVRDVVCDYGVFEDDKLISPLIFNSRRNAELVKSILEADKRHEVSKQNQSFNMSRKEMNTESKYEEMLYISKLMETRKEYDFLRGYIKGLLDLENINIQEYGLLKDHLKNIASAKGIATFRG